MARLTADEKLMESMIMKKLKFLSEQELNMIRGKASVGDANIEEIQEVFIHLDMLENKLDECDDMDMLGTEGWRKYFGVPDNE